jgi:tetratricopeptide (TPR) repeat protein
VETILAARGDWSAALGGPAAENDRARVESERQERTHLLAALRHYVNARNRCPTLPEPHLVLAAQVKHLVRADTRDAYLSRVKLLANGDPESWYECGSLELAAGQTDRAWASWRRCLELSDRYLPTILEVSSREHSPQEMVDTVLPDRPEMLLAVAFRLYPESRAADERRPFLLKAVHLLENPSEPLTLAQLHVKAVAHKSLGQRGEALAAYRQLLMRKPDQAGWRYEMAEVLHEEGQLEETRRELVVVLAQQPNHTQARELLALVSREQIRKK